jgi:F0F1-type ATP synthase epsilon subunit
MQKITVKILNTTGIIAQHSAELIVVPGAMGDIGLNFSERSVPYLLKAGVIYIFNNNTVEHKYGVIDGRFYYEGDTLIIISNFNIYKVDNKNLEILNNDIKNCEQVLSKATVEELKNYYNQKLNNYNLLLNAVNNLAY